MFRRDLRLFTEVFAMCIYDSDLQIIYRTTACIVIWTLWQSSWISSNNTWSRKGNRSMTHALLVIQIRITALYKSILIPLQWLINLLNALFRNDQHL